MRCSCNVGEGLEPWLWVRFGVAELGWIGGVGGFGVTGWLYEWWVGEKFGLGNYCCLIFSFSTEPC